MALVLSSGTVNFVAICCIKLSVSELLASFGLLRVSKTLMASFETCIGKESHTLYLVLIFIEEASLTTIFDDDLALTSQDNTTITIMSSTRCSGPLEPITKCMYPT